MGDKELIKATLDGNDEAFRELVKRHEARVAATVIGMLGKCPEAEDVGQETFIRFYKNLSNFRGESSVETYITRIAINLSINELKRRKRKNMLFFTRENENHFEVPDNNSLVCLNETKELVQHALLHLEVKFRSVVVLRLLDGYSTEETANILKIPTGTVLSRLARAQKKLKKLLSPYMEEIA